MTTNTRNTSTRANRWHGTLIWAIFLNSLRSKKDCNAKVSNGTWIMLRTMSLINFQRCRPTYFGVNFDRLQPNCVRKQIYPPCITSISFKCTQKIFMNSSAGLDGMGRQPPSIMGLQHCHGNGNNQLMRLNAVGQLGVGERCVIADMQGVKLGFCRMGTVDGPWKYDESTKTLIHRQRRTCITVHPQTHQLSLRVCDANNAYHQWKFRETVPSWVKND